MARNTILLRGTALEETRLADLYAMTPGMLASLAAAGTVIPHSVDGGMAAPIFVRESHENQGAGIDTDIPIDGECPLLFPHLGAKVNALTADTIAEGDYVASAGDGGVRLADSLDWVVGVAAAASDLSGSNGRVEIYVYPLGNVTA
jgi:hypothetical protein